jgi:hypothetical protein
MATITEPIVDQPHEDPPDDLPERYEMIVEIPAEVRAFLARLASETGGTEFDVLSKAFALYKVASDARREGKRIGILDDDFELDREIVGF